MPKLCATPQLVSAPLNPVPIEEQFRWSHPLSEHSNWTTPVKQGKPIDNPLKPVFAAYAIQQR